MLTSEQVPAGVAVRIAAGFFSRTSELLAPRYRVIAGVVRA